MIGFIMKIYYPIIGVFFSTAMTALYATSVYGQAGPDYADPRYPSPVAWYIRYSCDIAKPFGSSSYKHCLMAKGTFAVTIFMLFLYLCNLGLAVWAMLPNKELDNVDSDDEESGPISAPASTGDKQWEMTTPGGSTVPFTPRTQAFRTLDRQLPLRQGSRFS
jgi:hypothetical protein